MIKVIFLLENVDDKKKQVFAFFPTEKYNSIEKNVFMSYAHLGQHSGCHIDYANECKGATKEEYSPLLNELQSIGYELQVLNKK